MDRKKTVGFAVKSLSNLIKRQRHDVFEQFGITRMQMWIIGFVADRTDESVYQRDIESVFDIRRSTASVALSAMEKSGLISRVNDESDARLKRIVLLPRALEVEKTIKDDMIKTEKKITDGISKEEIDAFFSTIGKMKKNLE